MKKCIALFTALLMLLSLSACFGKENNETTTAKDTEPVTEVEFSPSIGYEEGTKMIAVAAAMGMRYCTDIASLNKPAVIEDILGWYCARQNYSGGKDYLTENQVAAIQHSILPDVAPLDMSMFTKEGTMEKDENYEGTVYKFPLYVNSYKGLFSNFEISTDYPDKDGGEFTVTLRDRVFDGEKEIYTFSFTADQNADKDFPYVLSSMKLPAKDDASSPAGITLTVDDLLEANTIGTLLDKYESVCVNQKDNRDFAVETYYYMWKEHYIQADKYIIGDETNYNFMFDNYYLDYKSAHYIATEYIDYEYDDSNYVNGLNYFVSGNIVNLKEKGDIYTFNIETDMLDEEYNSENYYEVRKSDLSLLKATFKGNNGYYETVTVDYNGEADTFGLTDGWDDNPERTVTVAVSTYDPVNGQADVGYDVVLPYNVELRVDSFGDYFCYLNSDYTKEYTYPGDGVDYTIYVTNAAG